MFITVLPKPDESYVCAAKMEDMTPYGKLKTSTKTRNIEFLAGRAGGRCQTPSDNLNLSLYCPQYYQGVVMTV